MKTDMIDPMEHKTFDFSPAEIKIEHVRQSSSGTTDTSSPSAAPSPFAESGAPINRSKTAEFISRKGQNAGLRWPRIRRIFREPFSEFLGTFILIMFGDGVVAQVVLSNGEKGDYQSISWGWVSDARHFVSIISLTSCRASVSCSASTALVSVVLISYVQRESESDTRHVLTLSRTRQ